MVGRSREVGRGKGVGGPSSSKAGACGGVRASFVASTNDSYVGTRRRNGFTRSRLSMSEGARHTERNHASTSDLKLRHARIDFISPGTSTAEDLNPVIEKSEASGRVTEGPFQERSEGPVKASENPSIGYAVTPDAQMSNMTLNDPQFLPTPQVKSKDGLDSMSNKRSKVEWGLRSSDFSDKVTSVGPEDVDGPGLVTSLMRRSPSLTGSDSSEEIIIFAGRRQSCNKGDQEHISDARLRNPHVRNASKLSGHRSCTAIVMNDPIDVKTQRIQASLKHRPSSLLPSSFSPPDLERVPDHPSYHSKTTATKPGQRTRSRVPTKATKDEKILDDYIANLRDGGDLEALIESSVLNKRDLGGSDTAEWQDKVESPPAGHVERDPMIKTEEWDSADLMDFDDFSTSNEILEDIEQVLSKRERPSGTQYLVVRVGCTFDDAHWLPVSSLNCQGAERLIQEFEDNAMLDRLNGSDVSHASLTIDEHLQEDSDDKEDEDDLEERRKARMTDEQVAKLLSKQEELGLGSDDLMLFNGDDVGTDSQEELQLDGLWERAVTHRAPSRSKRTKPTRCNFPSATAFADVLDRDPYNGFDVMNLQRPSLRKRPKGRRGKVSLELSDQELKQSIHTAWEKDRTKKKMRKQEREDLRAQGLLGNKNKPDLKAKYSEGISMTEVKKEIRNFLLSSMESLPLPPMAQGERKLVHEIANVFKLKSKSTGGGKSRFPILYRTSRTTQYNEKTLEAVDSMLSSGHFLPRMDRAKRKGALAGRGRGGGAASAGVSYRDGEVVGAAAPEIGQENRGRTMLERMGWSTGTALGALNNSRGLVQPVAQVVKTSRSGLG